MNEQNTKQLKETFPNLYKNFGGFECGDGWFDLLHKCSEGIEAEILKLPENEREYIHAQQVKEKFATLRFYMSIYGNKVIEDTISAAETTSKVTCEVCGAPGHMRTQFGWMRTECDECNMKDVADHVINYCLRAIDKKFGKVEYADIANVREEVARYLSVHTMIVPDELNGDDYEIETIP